MKFNINNMGTVDSPIVNLKSSKGINYFDHFDNFFPLVFDVPTQVSINETDFPSKVINFRCFHNERIS